MDYQNNDKNIKCIDCEKEFIFSESEQDFFQRRELDDPKRCKECRKAKKLKYKN